MMIEPDILHGVGVPVFVMSAKRPRRILAWNPRMAEVTGIVPASAVGQGIDLLFAPATNAVLGALDVDGVDQVPGLGPVVLHRQDHRIVVTLSDAAGTQNLALAVEDMRAPLRRIYQLAGDARQDVFAAEAALVRIRQIARQGFEYAPGRDRDAFRDPMPDCVALRPVCSDLLNNMAPDLACEVSETAMPVNPSVLKDVLRALFAYAAAGRMTGVQITAEDRADGVALEVLFEGAHAPAAPDAPGFREDRWIGLLTLRRTIRALGGQVKAARGSHAKASAIRVLLPRSVAPRPGQGGDTYLPAAE